MSEIPAWLQGELVGQAAVEFELHVATCEHCQAEASELRPLLGALVEAGVGDASSPIDLAPRILAGVRGLHFLGSPGAAACAGLVLGALVILCLVGPTQSGGSREGLALDRIREVRESSALREGTRWLLSAQDASGAWEPGRWGGKDAYRVGITGLALLALARAAPASDAVESALARGVGWLRTQQDAEGRLGPPMVGHLYNHGPGTVALLAISARHPCEAVFGMADRALDHLVRAQCASGGWGYDEGASGHPNLMISIWPLEALALAKNQGNVGVRESLQRATRWLGSLEDPRGFFDYDAAGTRPFGPEALLAAGAYGSSLVGDARTDLLEALPRDLLGIQFFLKTCDPTSPTARTLRDVLATRQVNRGLLRGSWTPRSDRWGPEGGRIYATAMGLMSIASN